MVGWTRRNREAAARRRRYREWFNSLSPEQQAQERKEVAIASARAKRQINWICGIGLPTIVLADIFINHMPLFSIGPGFMMLLVLVVNNLL